MQAVILAAGRGQRLAPLTEHLPKCLVPIEGEPLISHQIRALRKGGIQKIYVVVGSHKEKIQEFLKEEGDIQRIENPEYQTTNIIMSFWYALGAIVPEEDLIVMAGDVLFEDSIIGGLLQQVEGELTLCVAKKRCFDEEVKVVLEESRIVQLGKRLDPKSAYGEFLGVFKAKREVLKDIRQVVDEMIALKETQGYLFDMINRLIEEKKRTVKAFEIKDALWEDIDILEDIERVTAKLRAKKKPTLAKR